MNQNPTSDANALIAETMRRGPASDANAHLLALLARGTEIYNIGEASRGTGTFIRWVAEHCREYVPLTDEIDATPARTMECARAKATYASLRADWAPVHCRVAYAALSDLLAVQEGGLKVKAS